MPNDEVSSVFRTRAVQDLKDRIELVDEIGNEANNFLRHSPVRPHLQEVTMGFIIAILGSGLGIGFILMLLAYGLDALGGGSSENSISTPHQRAQTTKGLPPPSPGDRFGG